MDVLFWLAIYVFVNVILSAPVAYAAASKGRSPVGFFFLSFFFSFLVGILVVLAVPRVESSMVVTSRTGAFARKGTEDLFKCPYCAEWVKAEATVCRFCGKDISVQHQQNRDKEQKLDALERKEGELRIQEQKKASQLEKERRKIWFSQFIRSPRTRAASALLVACAVAATVLVIESRSWRSLVQQCDYLMVKDRGAYSGDSYTLNDSSDELTLFVRRDPRSSAWIDCIGTNLTGSSDGEQLGSYVSQRLACGLCSRDYRGLNLSARELAENSYKIVIRPGE